ncbi:MAG: DUF6144 family protein [Candidatus Bathyarchaeota archaeon]|nr:DUF6144 family protein [Candidatus Bathyarchaeota archaeon]
MRKMLVEMEKCIEQAAGKEVAEQVMEGSADITVRTAKKKAAMWGKEAVDRLDSLVDEETRNEIMQKCGYNCANRNRRAIERAIAKRDKYENIEEFLEAEQKNPMAGTKLSKEGDVLYLSYTPQSFTRPMRCYCSVFRELPIEETASITYCNCAKGFVEKYWGAVLDKPVKVDLLQSAISGAQECKFAIHMQNGVESEETK